MRKDCTRPGGFALETGEGRDYALPTVKLRTHLVLLVLAAVLPVVVFAGTMVVLFAKEERRAVESGLQETTRALALAVDRELAAVVTALRTLGASHHLNEGALEAFRNEARSLLRTQAGWSGITLADDAGRIVVTTKTSPATQSAARERARLYAAESTGGPVVSGYFPSVTTGDAMFSVGVPLRVAGNRRYVLIAGIRPTVMADLLERQRLSPDWVGAVVDAEGLVLARTGSDTSGVGRLAAAAWVERVRQRGEGLFRSVTQDGVDAYTFFSRVPTSSWTVALAVPAELVDAPVRRSVVGVIAIGTLVVGVGVGLALVVGRRIAGSLRAVMASASALARGERLPSPAGGVTEVQELARAFQGAADARRAFEQALAASEQRLRRVVESHVSGVVFSDPDGRITEANDAFLAITGHARADLLAGRLAWDGLTPAEYREVDRRAAAETRSSGGCRPYEKELVRKDGRRVPVIVASALLAPRGSEAVAFVHDLTELRWAQRERERLFALLDALLTSAPVGYAVLDRELRFVLVNDVLAELNGVPATRHIGRPVREIVPDIVDFIEPLHQRVLERGEPVLNVELATENASEWWRGRHYLRSYYPVRSRKGAVLGVGVVVLDITERKRAEQRMATQHAVTRILAEADSLDDAAPRLLAALCNTLDCEAGEIWRVDAEGGVLRCVEVRHDGGLDDLAAPVRDLAIPRGVGLPGRVWATCKPRWISDAARDGEAPRPGVGASVRGALAFPIVHGDVLGVAAFYARRVMEPDAELLEMLVSLGSQIGQFVERRRAEQERARLLAVTEQALRDAEASERRYRLFVEALPHIAWTARPDGVPEYLNRQWFEYTGLRRVDSESDWLSPLHPDDTERVVARWREALACGEGYEAEYRLRRRDGFYRWFLWRVEPIRDGAGGVVTWLGTAVDIDSQKRAELGAVHANRAKDTFLATLAHELRTPLMAILGWVRLLRSARREPGMFERAVDTIERNVKLQAQIVNDLLDVSRVIAGKLDLHVVPVDLGELLEHAVDAVRPAADAKSVSLSVSLDPTARVSAGDPERLQQVLGNLLTNAVKFTPAGGRVDVRLERRGARARISVRDSGKGIDPQVLPYIFERFRQAPSTSTSGGGLGLGLAIVKHLVELHGGTVYAESEGEGRGATFVVQLALADEDP